MGVEVTPPNEIVLAPWGALNPEPTTVTTVPVGPDAGERLEIAGVTEKERPLLEELPTVTVTSPVVAPLGTAAVMPEEFHDETVAGIPLKVTALLP